MIVAVASTVWEAGGPASRLRCSSMFGSTAKLGYVTG